jgi:uncharacterized protein YdeI (YjbR/CyaY-like superfamily)
MISHADRPVLAFDDIAEWERWLERNATKSDGVRLRVRKTSSTKPGVLVVDTLDVALCHGWIDGTRRGLDGDYFLQDYGPRRARSLWSQINRDHVARLIAEGRMRDGGYAEIERAKADGRWDAAYRQKGMEVPDDLAAALEASPAASATFAGLSAQNRFAVLFRIGSVKLAETRARKIATFVEMLERGETIYPQG